MKNKQTNKNKNKAKTKRKKPKTNKQTKTNKQNNKLEPCVVGVTRSLPAFAACK